MSRLKRNLTQKQLAAMIGVNTATISKMELGTIKPSKKTLIKIADALGLPAATFIESTQEIKQTTANNVELTQDEIDRLMRLREVDELGINFIDTIINEQRNRCRQYEVPDAPQIYSRKDLVNARKQLYCSPYSDSKEEKIRTLKIYKQQSYLRCDGIQTLLAYRGYNDLISILDLMLIFRGIKEPNEQFYNDLIKVLQESLVI